MCRITVILQDNIKGSVDTHCSDQVRDPLNVIGGGRGVAKKSNAVPRIINFYTSHMSSAYEEASL